MAGLFGAAPALGRRFLRDFCAPFWRQASGSRGATLAAHSRRGRVYATFLWREFAILDLPARDINNELGCLAEITGAFGMLVGHDRNYRIDCR